MKMKGTHSGHGHQYIPYADGSEYMLFYRTNHGRTDATKDGAVPLVINADTLHAHLQSHWGSEVMFATIAITDLAP